MRFRFVLLLAVAATAGCAGAERPELERASPQFRPELYFLGETRGEGVLSLATGKTRRLSVRSQGTLIGDDMVEISQVIRYDDGEVDRRKWTLARDRGRYVAGLTEAKGPVRVTQRGNAANIRYSFGSPRVRMNQWLYLRPDGRTVDNRAAVTLAGVTVATLRETITKDGG